MAKLTKKAKQFAELVTKGKLYGIADALAILRQTASKKMKETVEVAIQLGIDARKSDQMVRGATTLPSGNGKTIKVAVFAQGDSAKQAEEAGADQVGLEELAKQFESGKINVDVVIATPDCMAVVGKLGQILGPRGLMPNPKTGTVTADVATAVKNAKSGQIRFRTDKNGIIHGGIGKIDFEDAALQMNINSLVSDLKKLKPPSAKGMYIQKIFLSTTMGPGIEIDPSVLEAS